MINVNYLYHDCIYNEYNLFIYIICRGYFGPYSSMDWLWFVLLALISNLFGYSLFSWAVKWVSTNVISIATLFESIGAAILAYIIFSESLKTTQIIGGMVVIIGIMLFVVDVKNIKKFF